MTIEKLACTAILLATIGCGHAKSVESGPEATGANAKAVPTDDANAQNVKASHKTAGKSQDLPLASDPLQMLTPAGREQVRNALVDKGFLEKKNGSVPDALRKFQAQQKFPETGMPDDDTLLKLGLKPKDVVVRVRPAQ